MAYCLTLNGTSQCVTVADDDSLDFSATQSFTVEIQIKTATKAAVQGIISKLTGGIGWKIWLDTSGYCQVSLDDGTDEVTLSGETDLSDENWHEIELSVDRANQVARLFVGGTLITTSSISAVGDLSNAATLYIGADSTGAAGWFNGSVAEVRISNDLRSMEAYTPDVWQFPDDYKTAMLLHFTEGSGTTAYDMSAEDGDGSEQRNNGTYVGTPSWGTANLLSSPTSIIVDHVWYALDSYAKLTTAASAWGIKKYRFRPGDPIPWTEHPPPADRIPALRVIPGSMGNIDMATYDHYKFPQSIGIGGLVISMDSFRVEQFWWLCYRALKASFSIQGGRLGCGHILDFESNGPSYDIDPLEGHTFLWGFEDTILFSFREVI